MTSQSLSGSTIECWMSLSPTDIRSQLEARVAGGCAASAAPAGSCRRPAPRGRWLPYGRYVQCARRRFRPRCRGNRCTGFRSRPALRRRASCCRGCPARNGNRRSACLFPDGYPSDAPARRRVACRRPARASLARIMACAQLLASSSWLTLLALPIEQVALAVLLEHRAEDPAVAVEIGELRVPRGGLRSVRFARNCGSDQLPRAADFVGVEGQRLARTPRPSGTSRLRRIHQLAVGFLVPPHEPR